MNLSLDAQAVMAGFFFNPKCTLTMHNIESRLSPRAEAAINELFHAKLLSITQKANGAVMYKLTDAGAAIKYKRSAAFMDEHGRWSISEPIPESERTVIK